MNVFTLKDLSIGGNELISIGYKPGRLIGETLTRLLELVIDGKVENERSKLLSWANIWLKGD